MTRAVITATFYDRADYTTRVLEALRACRGIGDCVFLPHVEPGNDEVMELLRAADFCEKQTTVNREVLGVNANTVWALKHAFQVADFVIHVEDDILLAPDALEYFAWCRTRFANDDRVVTVAAYNRDVAAMPDVAQWHNVATRVWFHPWGWATWREKFTALMNRVSPASFERTTWDCVTNNAMRMHGKREAYPILSRTQNIGLRSSIGHGFPEEWYAEHHMLRHWAGDVAVPAGAFQCAERGERS